MQRTLSFFQNTGRPFFKAGNLQGIVQSKTAVTFGAVNEKRGDIGVPRLNFRQGRRQFRPSLFRQIHVIFELSVIVVGVTPRHPLVARLRHGIVGVRDKSPRIAVVAPSEDKIPQLRRIRGTRLPRSVAKSQKLRQRPRIPIRNGVFHEVRRRQVHGRIGENGNSGKRSAKGCPTR